MAETGSGIVTGDGPPQPVVYVLDDDAAIRESLVALLNVERLRCFAYETADTFLADFKPPRCGCLILDERLPGTSGLQVLDRLRKSGCETPVILIAGHGDPTDSAQKLALGIERCFEKPFDRSRADIDRASLAGLAGRGEATSKQP